MEGRPGCESVRVGSRGREHGKVEIPIWKEGLNVRVVGVEAWEG